MRIVAFLAILLSAQGGFGATKGKARSKANKQVAEEEVPERAPLNPNHFKHRTEVRDEFKRRKPVRGVPDLRGEYERRRDYELVLHYQRLAELDVIAEVAAAESDHKLADRVEAVRRLENNRFRAVMNHLRELIKSRRITGSP